MVANWFIALPFPAACLQADEWAQLPTGTRAFDPEDLHVTVAFLGAIGEQRALRAWERFRAGDELPVATTTGARATFGAPRRPSALGLDLDTGSRDGALTRFISEWRNTLRAAADLVREERPVRPHVTLGRPPRRTDDEWRHALTAWIDRSAAHDAVSLDRIALYTRGDPDGRRRFREVYVFPSPRPSPSV
jgi:2'-5' RNA ligase